MEAILSRPQCVNPVHISWDVPYKTLHHNDVSTNLTVMGWSSNPRIIPAEQIDSKTGVFVLHTTIWNIFRTWAALATMFKRTFGKVVWLNVVWWHHTIACQLNKRWSLRKFNTLRLRQDDGHFANVIFKFIFLNENIWISIKISLKFVPGVQSTIFHHWFR